MATFVNASSVSFSGASASLTKPSGLAAGDVQIVQVVCDNVSTPGISGGATWTQIGSNQSITSGDGQLSGVWRQVAGGSEPASYTVTNSGANAASAVIGAWREVDNTTPIAASLATNPNSGSPPSSPVSMAAGAITTTQDNQTVVYIGTVDWNSATAAAFTDPGSTTRRAVETPAQFSNGLLCDFVKTTAGSTGTITGTGTLASATGNFTAWLIALTNSAVPPVITAQPTDQSANNGGNPEFTVTATGTGTLHYQWYKNGATVGADSSTYTITGATYSDQGASVYVVVTDDVGSTTSNTVTLTINAEITPFQPNAFQSQGFTILYGTSGGGATTINATPGAWTWAGTAASIPVPAIAATVGAWTWAGTTASIPVQTIAQTPGAWTWAGTAAQVWAPLEVNATVGAWSWAGTAASVSKPTISATVGAWTWAGTAASIPVQTISATPGAWTWAGTTAVITTPGGATEINATVGAWVWAGAAAALEVPQIAATPGAWSWAGTTQGFTQLLNATPGAWVWVGTTQEISQLVSIDATPGAWEWAGTQATIAIEQAQATSQAAGGWLPNNGYVRRKRKAEPQEEVSIQNVQEDIVSAQKRIELRRTLRQAERKDRVLTEEIRHLLDQQDQLKISIESAKTRNEQMILDDEDILLVLALAS